MDFRQNTQVPGQPVGPRPENTPQTRVATHAERAQPGVKASRWMNLLSVALLFGVALLLVTTAVLMATRSNTDKELGFVSTSRYQAVFLNNGQVYFGHITDIGSRYLNLDNVYYLTQESAKDASGNATTSGNYNLVKLGCQQIHYPDDRMVISRDQITFWENLNDKGTVANRIADFKKQYPNGPDCTKVSNETQATSSPTTQTQATPTTKP